MDKAALLERKKKLISDLGRREQEVLSEMSGIAGAIAEIDRIIAEDEKPKDTAPKPVDAVQKPQ